MGDRPSITIPAQAVHDDKGFFVEVRRAFRRSLRTVVYLLRTVGLGILWTTVALFTGSSGNFFTGKCVADQNGAEILSTSMMWNQAMLCGFSILTQSAFLTKQRFIDRPDQPASYLMCVKRVFKATFFVVVLTSVFPVIIVFTLGAIAGNSSCVLHWSFYFNCIVALAFTAFLSMAVRRLFLETTVTGTQRQLQRLQESGPSIPHLNGRAKRRFRQFFRVMFQITPTSLANLFAGAYVQATSANLPSSQRDLAIFAICSIGLKLFIQELIKLAIVKRKVKDIRTMILVVAVPTVLIDTQVRVMLQLANNLSTTVGGSVLMAFIEIGMRSGKIFLLRAQIHRNSRLAHAPLPVTPSRVASIISIRRFTGVKPVRSDSKEQREESLKKFELWKMQLLRFHAAEAYADMAAEYMALGSSAMIVAVYADNPKYELSQWQVGISTLSSHESSRSVVLLGLQVAIEFVVDMVSCLVETAIGVNFDELKKYESFVMALFIVIGIMNVQITAIMYLKCE